jgi:hypothetical protein
VILHSVPATQHRKAIKKTGEKIRIEKRMLVLYSNYVFNLFFCRSISQVNTWEIFHVETVAIAYFVTYPKQNKNSKSLDKLCNNGRKKKRIYWVCLRRDCLTCFFLRIAPTPSPFSLFYCELYPALDSSQTPTSVLTQRELCQNFLPFILFLLNNGRVVAQVGSCGRLVKRGDTGSIPDKSERK